MSGTLRRRGSAAPLLMMVVAAMLVAAAVFGTRLSRDLHARRADDVRMQALWLARSALDAGVTGTEDVETPVGPAHVMVTAGRCVVQLEGGEATVTRDPWIERYAAAP